MCKLLWRTAVALRPFQRLIGELVMQCFLINLDETPVRMLKPGHGKMVTV